MISRLTAVVVLLALFSTTSFAGDHKRGDRGISSLQIRLNQVEQAAVEHSRDTLTVTTALYCKLQSDGETAEARGVQRQLEEILKTDLRLTVAMIERFELEIALASSDTGSPEIERPGDGLSLRDDRLSLRNARQLLRVKQRLASNFLKSISFAARYRTLTDFVGILNSQLRMSRIELADEFQE